MANKKPSNSESLSAILADLSNRVQFGDFDQRKVNQSSIATSLLLSDLVTEVKTLRESIQNINTDNNKQE